MPPSFERVRQQSKAVSPFVDTILVYQYLGMMNKPGSEAFAGARSLTQLYFNYVAWLPSHG